MQSGFIRRKQARHQRGLSLVEFLVAVVIGMLLVAAIGTLIANQSGNRAEIDKSGRMIENGRYAIGTLAADLQMAGYWGELGTAPPVPGVLPDPCDTSLAGLNFGMGLHVQGYDSLSTLPANLQACVKNQRPGTDVLVVRYVDPNTSDVETAGAVDWTLLKPGQVYLQTGLNPGASQFGSVLGQADGKTDSTIFTMLRKDMTTRTSPRKFLVHIYYVSNCSVEVSGSCTNADGGTPIPTLKRVELGVSGGAPSFSTTTIAEGIENFQVDYYGQDTNGDGAPDGDAGGTGFTPTNWGDVVSVKVHVLARSTEKTMGFADGKSYVMGTAGTVPAANDAYQRHLFVQSVRLVNPSGRKAF